MGITDRCGIPTASTLGADCLARQLAPKEIGEFSMRYHDGVARHGSFLGLILLLGAAAGACGSDPDPEEVDSPCVAFGKSAKASLGTEARPALPFTKVVSTAAGAGRTYVLGDGVVKIVEDAFAVAIDLPVEATTHIEVVADAAGTRLYTLDADATTRAPRVRRYASTDGGKTFDPASETILWTGPPQTGTAVAMAMAAAKAGMLYVAVGTNATTPPSGTIFRFDAKNGAGAPEPWMPFVGLPASLAYDDETAELWASVTEIGDGSDAVLRVRGDVAPRTEPLASIARNDRPDRVASRGFVYRGKALPRLAGTYVYSTRNGLAVVEGYGPSGLAQVSYLPLPSGTLARDRDGELYVIGEGASFTRVVEAAPPIVAPASLLASKCFDPAAPMGAVAGAIAYEVTNALWSDGAAKERFVVVPKGQRITQRPDGDLSFPVGTVAVKSFSVDGRRVETRLLVQHELEDWTGYSYAWNAAGTDAELVAGNRLATLPSGKRWYYPSTGDCAACHTPAAGYTLGLETRQLLGPRAGAALGALDAKTNATVDRSSVKALAALDDPSASLEARARSYLHSNCSICHRQGSIAGSAEIDLRFDTPLAESNLCSEPRVSDLGVKGARLVTPGAPERSVIALRMRALDERRMPKLASRVVDEAGLAAVEAWIKSLTSCP